MILSLYLLCRSCEEPEIQEWSRSGPSFHDARIGRTFGLSQLSQGRRQYGWQIWWWKALSLTLNTEDLLGSWVTLVMWRMKVDVIQYHMEVKKVKVVIIYGWGGDLTGQFVFEMSERHLWPSDFGKQRPQLLQCSYFSLPPTLVDTFVGGKKH